MASPKRKSSSAARTVRTSIVILLLSGMILLLLSIALPSPKNAWQDVLQRFIQELGIALLAVCGVSMIYELFVDQKIIREVGDAFRQQIGRGESNAAMCERLGILRIFDSRPKFEKKLPFSNIANSIPNGGHLCIIAKSLLFIMIKSTDFKTALQRGATIELCCVDPNSVSPALRASGLNRIDIDAAMTRFEKELVPWMEATHPPGTLELRHHKVDLFDSYFSFESDGMAFGAWDLSFGADVTEKRVLLLDPTRGLGESIGERYKSIWDGATLKFRYSRGSVEYDQRGGPDDPTNMPWRSAS